MQIKIDNPNDLGRKGIYLIRNTTNNKIYIGSTQKSFKARLTSHLSKLRGGKHGTPYLQRSWNKYGENAFQFEILEICQSNIIARETFYISFMESCDPAKGYNVNSQPSLPCSKEQCVKDKISATLKTLYREKILEPSLGVFKRGNIPHNKGKKVSNTENYKNKKTVTEALKLAHKKTSDRARIKGPRVRVTGAGYCRVFESLQDLLDWAKTEKNNLPVIIKTNAKGRALSYDKVYNALKYARSYKSLYFEFIFKSPLEIQGKLDELSGKALPAQSAAKPTE